MLAEQIMWSVVVYTISLMREISVAKSFIVLCLWDSNYLIIITLISRADSVHKHMCFLSRCYLIVLLSRGLWFSPQLYFSTTVEAAKANWPLYMLIGEGIN